MTDSPSTLLERLRDFAAGITPVPNFNAWLAELLVDEPPVPIEDREGALSGRLSFESEIATYLDMVANPDDPNFDEAEARRLAGSMCAVLAQIKDEEVRSSLAHLARWAPRTVWMIRQYVADALSRAALDRFLSRRHWPEPLTSAVHRLEKDQLQNLADGLEINEFEVVASLFGR